MITTIILTFIATSLFTWGLNAITQKGQIFYGLQLWIVPILGEKWSKPVINCTKCMPSVWGTVSFVILFLVTSPAWAYVLLWPAWCISLSGFNVLLDKFAPY